MLTLRDYATLALKFIKPSILNRKGRKGRQGKTASFAVKLLTQCKYSRGSVITPVIADAATVAGDAM